MGGRLIVRCFGEGDPLMEGYHDKEWGFPVLDERGLFERMSLEAFQSGLSWRTILKKRDAFRAAFAFFEPEMALSVVHCLLFLGSAFEPPRIFGWLLFAGLLASLGGDLWILRGLLPARAPEGISGT